MIGFLARWARRCAGGRQRGWFFTSWEAVYRSVQWSVQSDLAHREPQDVESIGVDEIRCLRRRLVYTATF